MKIGTIVTKVVWEVLIFTYKKRSEYTWKARFSSDDAAERGFTCITESSDVFKDKEKAKRAWVKWKKEHGVSKYRYVEKEEW